MKLTKTILFIAVFCASVSAAWATAVNVTQPPFNAVGDSSSPTPTDNLLRIQAAIDSLPNTGGTVYFPPGHYNVSGTLRVPSNVRLQGIGSYLYSCQIRLTATDVPLFEVEDGASNITFKDLSLVGWSQPIYPRDDAASIRAEGTTGISLKAGAGISVIVIENVRTAQFTHGISATSFGGDSPISNVNIRNYASEGNEYALYTNTRGADNWDVQNMNVTPMYEGQNGIFLELSGQMRFLQLSCASDFDAAICAKLWGNGDTYFRNMHVEGPRLGFCVGSDCAGSGNMGENPSLLTIENSTTWGEFHRATNLVSINNRFWLDWAGSPRHRFFGTGVNSWVMSCGDVWVGGPYTHLYNTTVIPPRDAFDGLETGIYPCLNYYLSSVPTFDQGFENDDERLLNAEVDITKPPYNANPNSGGNDTPAFLAALNDARLNGKRRIFVPSGTYDIYETLDLYSDVSIVGEQGSTINFNGGGALFRIADAVEVVRGITLRNLVLSGSGSVGISMENLPYGATDFQIQNVDLMYFGIGIFVQNSDPMYDSVSVKRVNFIGNGTAINISSQNASNWNLEDINVSGGEGVRVNGIGHLSIRHLTCYGGSDCVTVERQSGLIIDDLEAYGVTNALVTLADNGTTQFPITLRNSDLTAGVYFQGRVYLNSVNNVYPAILSRNSPSREVIFDSDNGIIFGRHSDIFSCNDTFKDTSTMQTQNTWVYSGKLDKPVTYCY